MKRALITLICLSAFTSGAQAMSMDTFKDLRSRAAKGDEKARIASQAYLSGVIDGILRSHADQRIDGLCIPPGKQVNTRSIALFMPMVDALPASARESDSDKVAAVALDTLKAKYPCASKNDR